MTKKLNVSAQSGTFHRSLIVPRRAARALKGRIGSGHYYKGWHATGTLGALIAAAACARLHRLDPAQTRHALALAASQAAGMKLNFGSMAKPCHAGFAGGLLSRRLTGAGGPRDVPRLPRRRSRDLSTNGRPFEVADV